MINTLILHKPLAKLGELLKKECPQNDCLVYRNTYEQYVEAKADYDRITEQFPDLAQVTVYALEHSIRRLEMDLYKMWGENYAVIQYRKAAGMYAENGGPNV